MLELIYGTTNPGKLEFMRGMLAGMDITLLSLRDLPGEPPEPDEAGATPLENARAKAQAYWRRYRRPVFSCDSGLFLKGVPPHLQPGVHVRVVEGKRLTDEEMTEYYALLSRRYGAGRLPARYQNAVCLVLGEGRCAESEADDLSGEWFYLADKAHARRREGFPLDRLSLDPRTGRYWYDLPDKGTEDGGMKKGFRRFFREALRA